MGDRELHRGLEDITVAETQLSDIDGDAGELLIRGFPVGEIAPRATFEEMAYVLLYDRLPTATELETFRADLARRRSICDEVHEVLRQCAAERGHPMDALRMGLAAATLGTDEAGDEIPVERVIAVVPTIVATYWRYRQGEEPLSPDDSLSHGENFLYLLSGTEPSTAAVRGIETYLNTVIDHGLNASTFTARVVISTESDLVSAATAAVGALKGPLHGGAPGPVLDMLLEVHDSDSPESYIRRTLDEGDRLMGFGHRVYRVRDPRAAVLSEAAEGLYDADGDAAFFATVTSFEELAVDLLEEYKPGRQLHTNVEFYTAALLHGIGVPTELFTPTFAIGRIAGWMAHAIEQRADNRLIRPRARYTGATDRTWVPIDER